jgi:hypothetical protein
MTRHTATPSEPGTHDAPVDAMRRNDPTLAGARLVACRPWPGSRSEDRSRRRRPAAKATVEPWACSCAISADARLIGGGR